MTSPTWSSYLRTGPTVERPDGSDFPPGLLAWYHDTDQNKTFFWNGEEWVEAVAGGSFDDWLFPYGLSDNISNFGSSSANGALGPGTTPFNPFVVLQGDKTSGPGTVVQLAGGGRTSTVIASDVTAATADQKNNVCFVQVGGNWEAVITLQTTLTTNMTTINTQIAQPNILWWEKFADLSSGAGSNDWCRNRWINRYLTDLYPGRVLNSQLMMQKYPPANGTDAASQAIGRSPNSLMIDPSHMNLVGNEYFSRDGGGMAPFADSILGTGLPFIPTQEIWSSNSTNQTNGGLVCAVPFYGSLTGCTVDFETPNADFSVAIESGEIRIRRATATVLTDAYVDLNVRIAKDGLRRFSTVRVLLGSDPASLAPKGFRVNGGTLSREDINGDANGGEVPVSPTQFSAVIGLRMMGGDGADQAIAYFANGTALNFQRRTTNRIDVIVYAPGGTSNRVSITSSSSAGQLFNVANGLQWLFVYYNIDTGVFKVAVNDQAATSGAITGTVTEFNLAANRGVTAASRTTDHLFSVLPITPTRPLNAEVHCLWFASTFVDFDVAANRNLFRDPSTKAALTLGTDGAAAGVTPYLYMGVGNGGDVMRGRNYGAGEDWFAAAAPGTAAFASL